MRRVLAVLATAFAAFACQTSSEPRVTVRPSALQAPAAAPPGAPPGLPEVVTFSEHVAPLLQRHCQECHRPDNVAPFPLLTYEDAFRRRVKVQKMTGPDGGMIPLVYIDDWDFDWQGFYFYRTPVRLEKGTRIQLKAVWDNSADNPRNPSRPPRLVTWGERTTDEMGHASFLYTTDDDGPAFGRR